MKIDFSAKPLRQFHHKIVGYNVGGGMFPPEFKLYWGVWIKAYCLWVSRHFYYN